MTEQQKPDPGKDKPISTWSNTEEPAGGPESQANGDAGMDPIPGTPSPAAIVDQPPEQEEPWTSPETESELDRLRRG